MSVEPNRVASVSGQLASNGVGPRDPLVHFTFDGQDLTACPGQTVAAALVAAGQRCLRLTSRRGEPRGVFCGMGVCHECLVQIDGRPNVQACRTIVRAGMRVETQHGVGCWEQLP